MNSLDSNILSNFLDTTHTSDISHKQLSSWGFTPPDFDRPVFKYLSIDAALAVLSNCTLKYSSPIVFNDPFELNLDLIDFTGTLKQLRDHQIKMFENTVIASNTISKKKWKKLTNTTSASELVASFKNTFEEFKKETMVLCLSEIQNNILMWSHYADKHSGICIGFKFPKVQNVWKTITLKVNYVEQIKKIKLIESSGSFDSLILKWIFTKFEHWAYEKEVRICFQNDSFAHIPEKKIYPQSNFITYVPFDPAQICEIYYGLNTSKDNISKIEKLLEQQNILLTNKGKMNKIENSFELGFDPLK